MSENEISRRSFLKDTAAGAASTAVLGGLISKSVMGANERIRVAVIGSGGRAQYLMKIFNKQPNCELVAVCDVYEPNRNDALKLSAMDAKGYTEYREVLDRKDVDAVLIGSPDHWHKQMLVDSVHAGKDAYLEKPIIHSIEEGAEIERAVEQTRRVVQTGTQQRSWEHYLLGKEIVDSGRLGKVIFVHTYWYQNYLKYVAEQPQVDTSKLDWKRWLGSAPDQPFDTMKFHFWRHYWDFGGGILTDLLTHWIDVIQWYLGQPAPQTATTTADTYLFKWQAPDAITTALEFPGDFMVAFTGAYNSSADDGGIEIRGSQATLKIDRARLAVYPEGETPEPGSLTPRPAILKVSERDGTIDHVKNFLDCVRSRKTPNAPVRAGFEAARTGWLGNIALKRGGKITFDASKNKVV